MFGAIARLVGPQVIKWGAKKISNLGWGKKLINSLSSGLGKALVDGTKAMIGSYNSDAKKRGSKSFIDFIKPEDVSFMTKQLRKALPNNDSTQTSRRKPALKMPKKHKPIKKVKFTQQPQVIQYDSGEQIEIPDVNDAQRSRGQKVQFGDADRNVLTSYLAYSLPTATNIIGELNTADPITIGSDGKIGKHRIMGQPINNALFGQSYASFTSGVQTRSRANRPNYNEQPSSQPQPPKKTSKKQKNQADQFNVDSVQSSSGSGQSINLPYQFRPLGSMLGQLTNIQQSLPRYAQTGDRLPYPVKQSKVFGAPTVKTMFQQYVDSMKDTLSFNARLKSQQGNKNSKTWQLIPNAKFSNNVWSAPGVTFKAPPSTSQLSRAQALSLAQVGPGTAIAQISPFLGFMNTRLKTLGFSGFGPVSKNGNSLYMGRWYDPKTNRVKAFMKPKYIYNPGDWRSHMVHSLFNLTDKWNQFARAQENLILTMKKYGAWDKLSKRKQKQTLDIPKAKKLAVKRLMSSLTINPIWKNLNNAIKDPLIGAISQWDWGVLEKGIADFVKAAKPVLKTTKQLIFLENLEQFIPRTNLAIQRRIDQWSLKGPISTQLYKQSHTKVSDDVKKADVALFRSPRYRVIAEDYIQKAQDIKGAIARGQASAATPVSQIPGISSSSWIPSKDLDENVFDTAQQSNQLQSHPFDAYPDAGIAV